MKNLAMGSEEWKKEVDVRRAEVDKKTGVGGKLSRTTQMAGISGGANRTEVAGIRAVTAERTGMLGCVSWYCLPLVSVDPEV